MREVILKVYCFTWFLLLFFIVWFFTKCIESSKNIVTRGLAMHPLNGDENVSRMTFQWCTEGFPHDCFETQINIDLCGAFHIQASLTKHCHFAFKGLNKGIQIKWIPSMTIKTCWVTDRQTVVKHWTSGSSWDELSGDAPSVCSHSRPHWEWQ